MKSETQAMTSRDTYNLVGAKCPLAGSLWSRQSRLGAPEVRALSSDFSEAGGDAVSSRKLFRPYLDGQTLPIGCLVAHVTFTTVTYLLIFHLT